MRRRPGARRARALRRAGLGVLAAAFLAGAAASAARATCEPWPGEPSPLPQVGESDELRARWAALRVRELTAAARLHERDAPGRAHLLWRRVLCLDPGNAVAARGLERSPLVAVHRPPLVNRTVPGEPADPVAALDHPLRLWRPTPPEPAEPATPPETAPETAPAAFEAVLGEAEDHLRAARFEKTLERVAAGRDARDRAPDAESVARLEVVGATAALALGRTDDAEAALDRALEADPDLDLDPASTPPKVRRAFERVRARREAP